MNRQITTFRRNIVYGREADYIASNYARQLLDSLGESRDSREGLGVDDAALVDDAERDDVCMECELSLDLIVVLPDRRSHRQHMLRVRVDGDLGKLRGERYCGDDGQPDHQPRVFH